MYTIHQNTICVEGGWLYNAGIVTKSLYDKLKSDGWLKSKRTGGNGRTALIEFETMRPDIKQKVMEVAGDPYITNPLKDFIKPDNAAIDFFAGCRNADGKGFKPEKQLLLVTNAKLFNAIDAYISKVGCKARNKGVMWKSISTAINSLPPRKNDDGSINMNGYTHTLPGTDRRLEQKFKEYKSEGYSGLLHGQFGNDNSLKVSARMEQLILAIYAMPNKPFSTTVHQIYLQFLGGGIGIADKKTGEIFDPQEFHKDGMPIVISEATVWHYINKPANRPTVDKYRSDAHEFNNTHRPHHHRHSPEWSLSKISMDDRDLPRKMPNGKRVKAYYSYDVASGAVIGASYSHDKNARLFIDCMRNMFRFLSQNNLGIPMEVEVEHHLVNQYKNDLMKAEVIFPFVRWCNPANSQEKRAEHFNKAKKYGFEKRYQDGIGRWYAKSEAHRTSKDVQKVFDETNNKYKEKTYSFETLVADDLHTVELYNNALHPNQKKYKGMSRLDVLKHCVNPDVMTEHPKALLARYIGECTETSIRRSQYMRVQYENYVLPSPKVLEVLNTNNYSVHAYYLPDERGEIKQVYVFQNDQFIAECQKITTYNEATAEQTDTDRSAYQQQKEYVSEFNDMVNERRQDIPKVLLIENTNFDFEPPVNHSQEQQEPEEPFDEFEDILAGYDAESMRRKAKQSL